MDAAAELTRSLPRTPAFSGEQWTIAADGHEAVVVEVGGGLRAYRADGVEHVDGYRADEVSPGSAGQILAPWPNRIRDGRFTFNGADHQLALTEPDRHTALHGLVNWARWRAVAVADDAVTLEHELVAQPGYPWPLLLRTRFSVGAGGLSAAHEVVNLATEPAPFGFSVHPYLQVPGVAVDDLVLRIPGQSRVLLDSRLLPIGTARVAGTDYDYTSGRRIGAAVLDVAFGEVSHDADGRSEVTLAGPDGNGVAVWADATFGWWQVYTGDTLSAERLRRSVAIEPMTCPPDAFRSGRDVIVLAPGASWRGTWGVRPLAG